jgi:hypothetical protein
MKALSKFTTFSAILLVLVFGTFSCEKKFDGNVPYKTCLYEEKMSLMETQDFPRGKAYLFMDFIPEQMENQINNEILSAQFPKVCWIVYDSETDVATFWIGKVHSSGGTELYGGTICNFPDFAKKWDIPENGIKVDIQGVMYETWVSGAQLAVMYHVRNYVLTNFKRR